MNLKDLSTSERIPERLFEELITLENRMFVEVSLDSVERLSLIYKFLVEYYAVNEDEHKYQFYLYKLQELLVSRPHGKPLYCKSRSMIETLNHLPLYGENHKVFRNRGLDKKGPAADSSSGYYRDEYKLMIQLREYIRTRELNLTNGIRIMENTLRIQKENFLKNFQLKKMNIFNYTTKVHSILSRKAKAKDSGIYKARSSSFPTVRTHFRRNSDWNSLRSRNSNYPKSLNCLIT